ncbi:MAG: hypothetical protein IKP00_05885 [Victivallales bacterium]|nr:hypothetical protein [Victivallales bacterium]
MADNNLDDVLSIFDEPQEKAQENAENNAQQEEAPVENPPAEEVAKPAAPKPGLGKPGMGKPGLGKPGMGKPGLGKPGMTGPRPPVGAAKPAAQPAAAKAPAQPAAAKPATPAPAPAFVAAGAPASSGGTSPLLFVLLALNAILLIVSVLSFVKVNALKNELTQIKLDTDTLKARSKVHAGIAYLGNDKRPQRFVMLLDFEKKPGSVEFGNEIMKPFE